MDYKSESLPLVASRHRSPTLKRLIPLVVLGAIFLIVTVKYDINYSINVLRSLWSPLSGPSTSYQATLAPSTGLTDSFAPSTGLTGNFELKHIYHHGAGSKNYKVHRRLDITPQYLTKHNLYDTQVFASQNHVDSDDLQQIYDESDWPKVHNGKNPWTLQLPIKRKSEDQTIMRLKERHTPGFLESYLTYAMNVKGNPQVLNRINLEWEESFGVKVPDVKDKNSLVSLATISSNAYVRFPENEDEKKKLDWIDIGEPWLPDDGNDDVNFGWADVGLRGHIFVNKEDNIVIIGIKGTSGAGLPGGGSDETADNDKTNDNLLFSCCCARVGYMWTTVCDCYEKTYTCNQDCLEKELMRKDRYYQAVLELYQNVTSIYSPDKYDIWVTGHSLGGSLASLLGRTFGLPVVAFEAPGEMLATKRLHLPQPPGLPRFLEHIWHFGNTADPIYMGVCNGASSSCNVAGYAMETACHTGKVCVYDVVTDKGWRVNLLNHRIHTVIDEIILKYNETAECVNQPPCRDCFNWRYVSHQDEFDDPEHLPNPLEPSTSSSTSTSLSSTRSGASPSDPVAEPDRPKKCIKRSWLGYCLEWGDDELRKQ